MLDTKKATLLLFFVAAGIGPYLQAKRPGATAPSASGAAQANPEGPAGGAEAQSSLDYQVYRNRIEPIFVKKRQGGVRCYDCHSVAATRLRLQPLSPGSSSWTDEQSRQNFDTVSKLVDASDPLKSSLLLHPLAEEAGGDPVHTGGKFWASQNDPEWQMVADWLRKGSSAPAIKQPPSRSFTTNRLVFEFFKSQVQPIFLKKRSGHAPCYVCHSEYNRMFRLENLPPGNATWTDEQSKRNFQNALKLVVPGDPASSRLLMHALAPEAGGDPFHSGGRQFQSTNDPDFLTLAEWVRGPAKEVPPASVSVTRIYVTNSAGDTVDVVDPATNKVVQVIRGVELPHGITFSPDGARVYISNESESVLDVVDQKSGEIVKKIPLSGRPNNIAIAKDGARVLVGIRTGSGALDVIDTTSLTRVKSIPVNGGVHNVFVTPDGKYAVSGSLDTHVATVVDLQSDQAVWEVKFGSGVRPMAFETNPDGSTRRIFVQLSGFHGFAVVDFAKRAEVARIKLPDHPNGYGTAEGRLETPSHGIRVAPDGKSLWVNSTLANAVFEYSLPDLRLVGHAALSEVHPLGHAPTGAVPEWITFTPDSKYVYVSDSAAGSVSVIEAKSLKEVALIPVGEVPKRINTLVHP